MVIVLDHVACNPLYVARDRLVYEDGRLGNFTYHPCTNSSDMNGCFHSVGELADYLSQNNVGNIGLRNFPERVECLHKIGGMNYTHIREPLSPKEIDGLRLHLREGMLARGVIECSSDTLQIMLKGSTSFS